MHFYRTKKIHHHECTKSWCYDKDDYLPCLEKRLLIHETAAKPAPNAPNTTRIFCPFQNNKNLSTLSTVFNLKTIKIHHDHHPGPISPNRVGLDPVSEWINNLYSIKQSNTTTKNSEEPWQNIVGTVPPCKKKHLDAHMPEDCCVNIYYDCVAYVHWNFGTLTTCLCYLPNISFCKYICICLWMCVCTHLCVCVCKGMSIRI